MMVRDFQAVIGKGILSRCPSRRGASRLRGGLRGWRINAIGIFIPICGCAGCAAGRRRGCGRRHRDRTSCRIAVGRQTRRAARKSHLPAAERGRQIIETHSISAGLDYPGVGPEHALAPRTAVAHNTSASPTPKRSRHFTNCAGSRNHPSARVFPCAGLRAKSAPTLSQDQIILVNLPDGVTRICIRWPRSPASSSDRRVGRTRSAGLFLQLRRSKCPEFKQRFPASRRKVERP